MELTMYQLLLHALYLYKNVYNEELAIVWLASFFFSAFLPYSLYYLPLPQFANFLPFFFCCCPLFLLSTSEI